MNNTVLEQLVEEVNDAFFKKVVAQEKNGYLYVRSVELKDYNPREEKCAIRIIKPMNIKIPEGMHFNIIDNDKIIGTGKISI